VKAETWKQFKLQLFGHHTANYNHCPCSSVCVLPRDVCHNGSEWTDNTENLSLITTL